MAEIAVPEGMSSVILGKGGRAIQTLQKETKTRLTLLRGSAALRIEGRNEQVEDATARVEAILAANGSERVEIESASTSILIGQGGKTISALEKVCTKMSLPTEYCVPEYPYWLNIFYCNIRTA